MNLNSPSPRMKRGMGSRGGPGKGRIKPTGSGPQQSQGLEGLYSNDRLVNAVTSVLGCTAKVTGKNGKQFEGVFKTISPEASLVLGKANQVEEEIQNGVVKNDIFEQLVMHHKDWVKVEFKDVNLEECLYKKVHSDSFKTDVAIAGNKRMNGQKKELEKWTPGDVGESLETLGLESNQTMEREVNGWSAEKMFHVNEKMYGVKSTYNADMEEYTTKLEKTDTPEYREKEKFAAQKAEEINKESPYERNTFDSGRSEEQLYSSVVRNKFVDRSSTPNWRQPHGDRPPEQRTQRSTQENSGSPVTSRREPVRSQQNEDSTKVQVKEKVEKPVTETPVESKAETKLEAFSEVVKADTKPAQTVSPAKSPVVPANTPVTLKSTQVSTETLQDPTSEPPVAPPKTKDSKVANIDDLKSFSVNFKLPETTKKKTKPKKVLDVEEKTSNVTTNKEEKDEEPQTPQEINTESESDKKAKTELNPNALEFRPRVKRNTPSPRSNNTTSSSGTPFQNNSPFTVSPPYPPNNIYSRPRVRAMRPEYMDPTTGYMNASNATGQPFFAHHIPPQFLHQPSPPGMSYIPPGGLRHPGMQHPLFIQQHHQGPMMVPVAPGHYPDNAIYYSPMPMIQSPPQITSPSLQQSQFNFPSPAIPQSVNPVRPVNQPAVMAQQPPVFLVRQNPNNEIPPTQIMTNRAAQAPSFQGN